MVHCASWAGRAAQQPQQASLVEFFAAVVQPEAAAEAAPGPSLHAAYLALWRLLLTAHGLASDEHVKLIGMRAPPCSCALCSVMSAMLL